LSARRGIAAAGVVAMMIAPAAASEPAPGRTASRSPIRSRFALANRCVAVVSGANGRYVATASSSGYAAGRADKAGAEAFFFKPTGLGRYMLYDTRARLVGVNAGRVTGVAAAGPSTEWAPVPIRKGPAFTIRSTSSARGLAVVSASGALMLARASGRAGAFTFEPDSGCRRFPEARVDATGRTFKGANRDGTVFGFVERKRRQPRHHGQSASYRPADGDP
jgi:hypothetical protein